MSAVLCRPSGTRSDFAPYPGLTSWANLFRPSGAAVFQFSSTCGNCRVILTRTLKHCATGNHIFCSMVKVWARCFRVLPVSNYHSGMNLGFSEMLFLFVLALLIFGPRKLPEIGRQIGRFMSEFKRASNEFRSQIQSEIDAIEVDVKPQILPPIQEPLNSLASRIFNPPSAEKVQTAAPPAPEATPEPPPAPKAAPDA